ncbi:hypothetical protein UFOVP39_62 [uncultured Caudovirales phage]|uniref:Uncharacterized protein n=1 Tax=uncultured Caudovirales phage TaxID=2100421 RepID=A0A6J5T7U2_9CAUD|nr:hypothetical protein UFOVP39_62 [uncultured Caudovirales phage]
MANNKISALTFATTPLAGTETLPIVQSSATTKVTVANLTAGRSVSVSDLTASTGNLIVGTSGKGLTTSGAFALGLGTNGSTSQVTINTAGVLSVVTNDALINGLTVGRGATSGGATNGSSTAVGIGTLGVNGSGIYNTGVGYQSLYTNAGGSGNVCAGVQTLYSNTSGNYNTAVGSGVPGVSGSALGSNTTGSYNTAIGNSSGTAITTGSSNVIIGGYTGSAAPISATGSNYVVFSDGAGNVRGYYDSTGNLIVPVAAKGVNFTANTPAAGMTSQLLNWYEEGTWTPADASGAGLTFTSVTAKYTRIGRQVTATVVLTYPTTASTAQAQISGLPFAASNFGQFILTNTVVIGGGSGLVAASGTTIALYIQTGASRTNVACSGATVNLTGTYFV